jgi:LysM repeat protein
MGLFDRFFKSFDAEVQEAIDKINGMNLGIKGLTATVDGKMVTVRGEAPNRDVSAQVMKLFNQMVETDNTLNTIKVDAPPPPAPEPEPEPKPELQVHEVVSGDTLGAIALKYYGNAGKYMKIFEANRDILDNPDLIKVGQKLKIPK